MNESSEVIWVHFDCGAHCDMQETLSPRWLWRFLKNDLQVNSIKKIISSAPQQKETTKEDKY